MPTLRNQAEGWSWLAVGEEMWGTFQDAAPAVQQLSTSLSSVCVFDFEQETVRIQATTDTHTTLCTVSLQEARIPAV